MADEQAAQGKKDTQDDQPQAEASSAPSKPEPKAEAVSPAPAAPKRKLKVIRDKDPNAIKPFIIATEKGLPLARFRTEEDLKRNLKRFQK